MFDFSQGQKHRVSENVSALAERPVEWTHMDGA